MPTVVLCSNPTCTARYTVADEVIGRQVKCKKCGTSFKAAASSGYPIPPSPAKTGPLPKMIGRYQVRAKLGAGAFGIVYRAHDPQLDREVALKLLNPETLSSPQAVERFQREARATARLLHPNIVPVFDAGQQGSSHFIASAFIPGRTLAEALPSGGMEARKAVALVIQLADALAYAHEQGVLHRDVKSGNVMLDAKDRLYLMDFGLAGWIDQDESRMTRLGAVMGTPAYMSPEQAAGDHPRVGPAADQYGAAVVLYELLTSRLPFEGPPAIVIYHVLNTAPKPPSEYRSDLDRRLDAICLKALAKQPEERYPSAESFAAVLRAWLTGAASTIPGTPPLLVEVEPILPVEPVPVPLPTYPDSDWQQPTVLPPPAPVAPKAPPTVPVRDTQKRRPVADTDQVVEMDLVPLPPPPPPVKPRLPRLPRFLRQRARREGESEREGLGLGFWAIIVAMLAAGGVAFWLFGLPILTRSRAKDDAERIERETQNDLAAATKLALNYMPDDSEILAFVRLNRLIATTGGKVTMEEIFGFDGERQIEKSLGIPPHEIDFVVVGGRMHGDAITACRLKLMVKAEDVRSALRANRQRPARVNEKEKGEPPQDAKNDFVPTSIGRFYTLYVSEREAEESFCVVSDRMIVYGQAKDLRAVLEREGAPKLPTPLRDPGNLSSTQTVLMVFDPAVVLRELRKQNLNADLAALDNITGLTLSLTVRDDIEVRVVAKCKDRAAAVSCDLLIDLALATYRNQLQDSKLPMEQAILTELNKLKITRSDSTLIAETTLNLANLLNAMKKN